MADVNIGTVANDGTGDPLRTAFDKLNGSIHAEVEARLAGDAALTAIINAEAVMPTWRDPGRPGDNPLAFTTTLAGAYSSCAPLGAGTQIGEFGRVQLLSGAGIVALRDIIGFGRRVWQIHAEVVRTITATDPLGDGITLRVAWLDYSKNFISSSTLETEGTLPLSSGAIVLDGKISSLPVDGVTAPPFNAVYARPYVQTWGSDGQTAIVALRHTDITEAHLIDTADLSAAITEAQEATDAANAAAAAANLIINNYTRAEFVTINLPNPGLDLAAGHILYLDGLAYKRVVGSTAIPDLHGWEPAGIWDAGHFKVPYGAAKSGGGRWTGSDATAALQIAMDAASAAQERLLIRKRIVIAHKPGKGVRAITPPSWVSLFSMGGGMICHDYDPAETHVDNTYKGFSVFKSTDWGLITADDQVEWKELFRVKNLAYRGLWDEHPRARAQGFAEVTGYRRIELFDLDVKNVSGQFFKCDYCESALMRGGSYVNLASGSALRLRDTGNIVIDGVLFDGCADDMIDCHASDPTPNSPTLPRKVGLRIVNCTFKNGRAITCLASAETYIAGNNFDRTYGAVSFIGNDVEGQAAIRNITIVDNHFQDIIRRPDGSGENDNTHVLPTVMKFTNFMSVISFGNAQPAGYAGVAAPRTYDATLGRFIEPYYPYAGMGAGAMWSRDTQGAAAGPPTTGVTVARNHITRTLPPRGAASDWGLGPLFTHYGFYSPPITADSFVNFGIAMYGPTVNVQVADNIVSGGLSRAFVIMDPNTDSTRSFERIVIERNLVEDVPIGILAGRANDDSPVDATVLPDSWGLVIRGNDFRLDPFLNFATRNATTGAWASVSNSEGVAISMSDVSGVVLDGNTFMDCSRIVRVSDAALATWDVRGNVAKGYIQQIAFNTSNIGIGTGLDLPQEAITYHDIVTDKTSLIYGTVSAVPLKESAAVPAAGCFYRRGHRVANSGDPVVGGQVLRGWIKRVDNRTGGIGASGWTADYGTAA